MPEIPVTGKLNVSVGKKSVDKLVDAVVDVFSPGTELLGALGDAVRLGRVEMAARTVRRAGEIADANGMTLKAPPLKFLVPFFEKASIEEDVGELTEMWANLLCAASTKYDSNHLVYSNILSLLGTEGAHFF